MNKLTEKDFNIHIGHSLEEYLYKYGSLYNKNKLVSYSKKEFSCMDKNRTYWAIEGKDKSIRYYELPKHRSVFRPQIPPRYNKPFKYGLIIVLSTTLLSFTSLAVGKSIYGKKNFDDIPEINPDDPTELLKVFDAWTLANPGIDATTKFGAVELANVAMGKLTHQSNSNYCAVGFGHSNTNILISQVIVDISNCFICHGENSSDESISYGNQIVAPKVSRRDFLTDGKIYSHDGSATSSTSSVWNKEPTKVFDNKKDYIEAAGKDAHNPFLYVITKKTVLTDSNYDIDPDTHEKHYGNSSAVRESDGTYKISLDLHNELAVKRYAKRMEYLSGKTPNFFRKVHLDFYTDDKMVLKESRVEESYSMVYMATTGDFKTRYYTTDVPNIPGAEENFDYEKYKF